MPSWMTKLTLLLITLPSIAFSFCYKDATPWFTGPLVTGSAVNQAPGTVNTQPYLYVRDSQGLYSRGRHFTPTPDIFTIHATTDVQTGITKWLDFTLDVEYFYRERERLTFHGYGDTTVEFGFQLMTEKRGSFEPNIRFKLSEIFPTGNYKNFDEKKKIIESSSGGTYETSFELILSKTVYWMIEHPMSFRTQFVYSLPTNVDVTGFNSYGGGYGTKGTVKPGQAFILNGSYEFSFTRHFAFAFDISNAWTNKTSFSGAPGVKEDGREARNSFGSQYILSIAPALEYNINENYGLIAGVWYSLKGKNSVEFFSYVLSTSLTF